MNDDQPRASVLHRIGSFFSLRDDEPEEIEEIEEPRPRRNVLAFSASSRRGTNNEVSIFAPRSFGDVTEIADALRNRQVVIVNLLSADRSLVQRIVDFASGVAYTLDGRIQKLADGMFLIVPPGVAVNSQGIRDSLAADGMFEFLQNRGQ